MVAPRGSAVGFAHPIVDGGVWTNFPMFVFEDARFRAFHGLPPLGDLRVTGFLLVEPQTHGTRMGPSRTARFVTSDELDPHHRPRMLPAEALLSFDADDLQRYAAPGSAVAHAGRSLRNTAMKELLSDPRRIPGWRATPKGRSPGQAATSSSWGEIALRYVGLLSESLLLTLAAWAVAVWGFGIAVVRVYRTWVAPRTSWREVLAATGVYVIGALGLTILGLFIVILVANALAYNALRKTHGATGVHLRTWFRCALLADRTLPVRGHRGRRASAEHRGVAHRRRRVDVGDQPWRGRDRRRGRRPPT